jgi:hypothetical protein
MDPQARLERLKQERNIFTLITFALIIGTVVFTLIGVIPYHIQQVHALASREVLLGFWVLYGIVFLEMLLGGKGLYALLWGERDNGYIIAALLISSFNYQVYNVNFVPSITDFGFYFSLGVYSIGINIINVLLLIWYISLWFRKNHYQKSV